jgi:uncharacterized protein
MLALLSPAKKLDARPIEVEVDATRPALLDHTRALMETARELSPGDLSNLMSISENLASLNHERFQAWEADHTDQNSLPAALTFAGDTYVGLDARSLTADDLAWAQDHVAILSGLYGLLRPLDRMQPYRLEMGTRLATHRGEDLYAFWDDHIARRIQALTAGHDDPTIVNLASKEYFSAVRRGALDRPVITPVFQDVSGGKARTISFYAKQARGAMARWIITERATRVDALRDARPLGYTFDADASTDTRWVYRRPKPPPKSQTKG